MKIRMLNRLGAAAMLAGVIAGGITLVAAEDDGHYVHAARKAPAKLVEVLRAATRQYADVNAAVRAGCTPMFGCVSGPDHGAMGVHYVNPTLVGDGQIDAASPEAIIYEPSENGMQMVGVEYIVDAAG